MNASIFNEVFVLHVPVCVFNCSLIRAVYNVINVTIITVSIFHTSVYAVSGQHLLTNGMVVV